jgi:hypothetical protein
MSKLIIGIHGLANKPERAVLETYWRAAIAEGLEKNRGIRAPRFDFRLVYWADLLYKSPMHQDENFHFDKLYNDEPYVPADPGALKERKDNWLDEIVASGRGLVGSGVDQLKEHFGMDALADWVLGRVLKDLDFYYDRQRKILNRKNQQELALKVLRDELKAVLLEEKEKQLMVISHSMGTIIGYDVLRDLGMPGTDSDVTVDEFVTIGSPLGLPHVLHKIRDERTYDPSIRTPSIVTGCWINYADRKDPVCADVHLDDEFSANGRGVQVKDDIVLKDYHRPGDPKKRNHHKSYGYLRTPELSKQVMAFLGL